MGRFTLQRNYYCSFYVFHFQKRAAENWPSQESTCTHIHPGHDGTSTAGVSMEIKGMRSNERIKNTSTMCCKYRQCLHLYSFNSPHVFLSIYFSNLHHFSVMNKNLL